MRPKATEKGLDLKLDLDASLEGAAVVGDSKRTQQVLNNLMWNALKFTPEGRVEPARAATPTATSPSS